MKQVEAKDLKNRNGLALWFQAIRPKTLSMALMPVLVGNLQALHDQGSISVWILWITALSALTIQIGTNLHNDHSDFASGGDGPDRLGPQRVTAGGLISPERVRQAAWLSFAVAFLAGSLLVWIGGWPILTLGLLSLTAGWAYSGGPKPISHSPFGELFVLCFFGLAAVAGSYYLQTSTVSFPVLLLGAGLGCFAAAVLMVNNHRDRDADRRQGRRTLAIAVGEGGSRWIYGTLMLLPFAVLVSLLMQTAIPSGVLLAGLVLPQAAVLIKRFFQQAPGSGHNQLLASTAKCQLLFAMAYSLGLFL